jgi:Uma2 family endonuclease
MTIAKSQTPTQSDSSLEEPEFFPAPPTNLPCDDGEPLETPRHRAAMNLLIESLDDYWSDRSDYFVGGNMFLYYSADQVRNKDFRGPDFFAVLGADRFTLRKYWAIWDEAGKYPDVIIELMSDSTAAIDTGDKKHLYERTFKTSDYFVYDPYAPQSLQGWHLDQNQKYQPLQPNPQGRLWCQALDLWVGTWDGTINREFAPWLRFYDVAGNLILLDKETAQQQAEVAQQQAEVAQQEAEQERQRAERLAEQLRLLGVSPKE